MPGWRNGRRCGLKIRCPKGRAGSTPALGTNNDGDEPETKSAALLVLMSSIEDSAFPKSLANTTKHLALARCGDLNLYCMVEAQVATVEQLFANVV